MLDEQHNELNNIILNRDAKDGKKTKILVGVGALALILIIIVVTMGMMDDEAPAQLPSVPVSSAIPASEVIQPNTHTQAVNNAVITNDDAAPAGYEEVVEEEVAAPVKNGGEIVFVDEGTEEPVAAEPAPARTNPAVKPSVRVGSEVTAPKKSVPAPAAKPAPVAVASNIFVQVGSFSRLEPNKAFIGKIEANGYAYRFYRVGSVNKVLIGPYASRTEAKQALTGIRQTIEPGAFIYTIQ